MAFGEQKPLSAFRSAAAGGKLDRRFLTVGHCGIYLLFGLVMASARVLEDGAPFGLAMVACAGPGLSGVSALAGAALAYLLGGGLEWGIRYTAACVVVYTVAFVFHELPVYRRDFFMPAIAGAVMALTGFLGSYTRLSGSPPLAASLLLESVLAFGGA